jgi:hypothetical protein
MLIHMSSLEPNFNRIPEDYVEYKFMEKQYFNLISPYVDTESALVFSKVIKELYTYKIENHKLKQQIEILSKN